MYYTVPADGNYTIELYGYKAGAGGAYWADYDSAVTVEVQSTQ